MKRFLLFLLLVIAACSSHAQSPIIRYLGYPKEISFFQGIVKVDSSLYIPVRDTNFVPLRVGGILYRSADSSIYVSISITGPKKWQRLGSGSLVSSPTPWGQIPGNIADQADLATALQAKQNILPFGDYTQYIGGDQNLYNFHDGVVAITDPTYSKIGHTHSPNDILGLLDYIHNALTVTGNATYNASTGVLNVTGGGTGSYTFASPLVNDGSGHISIPSIDASLITSGTKSHTFINDFDAYSRSLYSALLPLGYNQATGVFSVDTTTYLATKPYVANYVATHTGGAAGGDLSGTYPNPTVAQFNGQLPSYYLSRANHTGTQLSSTISDFTTAVQTVGDVRYARKAIDSVWRKVGSDSVFYRMNGLNYFAFHDSIGTTGGSYTFQYSLTNVGGNVNLVGDSASLVNSPKVYGYDATAGRGWKDALSGTLGSKRNNWLFAYDSTAKGYKLVDPATLVTGGTSSTAADSLRVLAFHVGDLNAPQDGDSMLFNTGFTGKYLRVVRERNWQYPGDDVIIDTSAAQHSIKFIPSLVAGERIYIEVRDYTNFRTLALQGGATQLATPTVTFGTVTGTSIVVNWSSVLHATNYVVKRNTSNTIASATQIYSGGLFTFTDASLSSNTTYYYFVIAQATGYTDSNPGSGSQTTSGGLAYTPLNFATQTGLTNTGGVWQGGGGIYASYGLADKKLAASTDGFIVWQYGAVDGESAMLAFDAQNTSQAYSTGHYIAAAHVYQGTIYRIDNGGAVTSTGVSISVGSYLRIIRTAGVTKLQKSVDGTTWTDVYTYAGLNAQTYANVDFFVNINIDGTNKCYYPQQSNLQ